MRYFTFLFLICFVSVLFAQSNYQITGVLLEKDSVTAVPFAYIINLKNGNGAVSNYDGKFTILASAEDTLSISCLGYQKKNIPVNDIDAQELKSKKQLKVILLPISYNLKTIEVNAFRINKHEREYINRIINRPKSIGINAFESPVSALYESFSRKGKAIRKLASLYEQLLINEQVERKLNPEILRKLTGDNTIDFEKFKKFCYAVNDQYIIMNDGYDLYAPIMDCYRRWKQEGR